MHFSGGFLMTKRIETDSMGEIEGMNHKLNLAEFYLIQERVEEAKAIILPILDTKDISSSLKTRAEELSGKLEL